MGHEKKAGKNTFIFSKILQKLLGEVTKNPMPLVGEGEYIKSLSKLGGCPVPAGALCVTKMHPQKSKRDGTRDA